MYILFGVCILNYAEMDKNIYQLYNHPDIS